MFVYFKTIAKIRNKRQNGAAASPDAIATPIDKGVS